MMIPHQDGHQMKIKKKNKNKSIISKSNNNNKKKKKDDSSSSGEDIPIHLNQTKKPTQKNKIPLKKSDSSSSEDDRPIHTLPTKAKKSAEIRAPVPKIASGYIDEEHQIKQAKPSPKKNSSRDPDKKSIAVGYSETGFDSEEEKEYKKPQAVQPKAHPMVRRVSKVRPVQGNYIEGNDDD